MTGGHGIRICEYGYQHGRCRCPCNDYVHVTCDDPAHKPGSAYKGKHAKEPTR